MYRIMIVDDEEATLRALKRILNSSGCYHINTFSDPQDALTNATTESYDLILSDYRMPVMDGVQLLTAIKEYQPDAARLILSAYTDLDALMGAINEAEIYRFITKPWQAHSLRIAIQRALEHRDLLLENKQLANQVRAQQRLIDRHKEKLEELERSHPGISKLTRSADGCIVIDVE